MAGGAGRPARYRHVCRYRARRTAGCNQVPRPAHGAVGHTRDQGVSMKAVVYEGPRQVSVKEVPDARIERPTDVLVRITSVNI